MKKLFILFLFTILIQEKSNAQYFQNESWSVKGNPDFSSFTIINHFFFADDGTFTYNYGYSSGTYHNENYWGRYKYNSVSNVISFDIIGSYARGIPDRGLNNVLPDSITVLSLNKDSVVIKDNNKKPSLFNPEPNVTYIRTKEGIKESWLYTNGDTRHCFTFYKSGNISSSECYYEYHNAERSFISLARYFFKKNEFRLSFIYIKGADNNNLCKIPVGYIEFDVIENNSKVIKLKFNRHDEWRNDEWGDFPFPIEETIEFIKK